ncbi:hypothetical protein B0H15DRAFT_825803 [Mycena belliarum]|uniref:Uncharacterized protein n=1 Tax=Mycena belliarum TaxID=1033014 RepID=A0AAD6UEY6_9AGAR|nr:hypothetical protein B0H15DRAFT_825803 [Mycena belliae]
MPSTILPVVGAYVVLTIDPVASLDPDVLEDPEAVQACKELVNRSYVVFVGERTKIFQPWSPYNDCMVDFLIQGKPKSFPAKFVESSMSIPIVPMTITDHPSSRIPLKPSNSLPWNDCYISTLWSAEVRSPTLKTEVPIACQLDDDEMDKLDRFLGRDFAAHKALRAAAGVSMSPTIIDSTPNPGQINANVQHTAPSDLRDATIPPNKRGMLFSSPADLEGPNADGDDDGEARTAEEMIDYIFSNPASNMTITVNFNNDLSTVEALNDPADYFREVKAIARIQEESRSRLASARAVAIKEAAELNAKYDEPTIDMLVSRAQRRGRLSRLGSATKKRIASTFRPVLRCFARATNQ